MVLTVADEEADEGTRDVVIETIRSENSLRYRDWIENRRALVEEHNGTVGIYGPTRVGTVRAICSSISWPVAHAGPDHRRAMEWGGQTGRSSSCSISRSPTTGRHATEGLAMAHRCPCGPKAMLINGLAGSGGDMFPWLFRENDLGPLIGTRTWGGLVGISGNPGLIDGGYTAVPTFGFYGRTDLGHRRSWCRSGHRGD